MTNITHFEKVSLNQFILDSKNNDLNFNFEVSYNNIKLPKRATINSAGYDFYLPFDVTLKPGQTITIPTGIRCQMNEEFVLQIFPRSSLGFKYRLQLDNTVGIIDSDYYYAKNEGHIMIKITNLSLNDKTLDLKTGDAFVQGLFIVYGKTNDDDTTEVRYGGFGSTNK